MVSWTKERNIVDDNTYRWPLVIILCQGYKINELLRKTNRFYQEKSVQNEHCGALVVPNAIHLFPIQYMTAEP